MNIHIVHYAKGAAQARCLVVVIDVFRAFSAACYAFDRGAEKIIATHSLDTARALKKENPQYLLMGERHAVKPEDFDLGNSPSEIAGADLSGKTLVHTTHAGTKALLAVRGTAQAITGSFVNAAAIVGYIRKRLPDELYLVCAGFEGQSEAAEDTLCAEYLKRRILGDEPDFAPIAQRLKTARSALRFFDPKDRASPTADFHMCLSLDRFNVVIRRTRPDTDTCVLVPTEAQGFSPENSI